MEKRKSRTMEKLRKPFQGVANIIRFNLHYYVGVILLCIALFFLKNVLPVNVKLIISIFIVLAIIATFVSLVVSFYIYDLSGLYKLNWFPNDDTKLEIVNINAGFDETSELIIAKYSKSNLTVLDFYDPQKHTEISIKIARKAYPAFPNTLAISTENIPFQSNSVDKIFVLFSAHEIRDEKERIIFFRELNRILKPTGEIYVTEHLRDLSNFFAYNIGCFHFLSNQSWLTIFSKSKLIIKHRQKINAFITNFTLTKNGITT